MVGILIAYAMGYALAGFTTFAAILGRYNYYYGSNNDNIDSSCSSVLEQGAGSGFSPNVKNHFQKFCYRNYQAAVSTQTTKSEVCIENKRIHFGYCRECMYFDCRDCRPRILPVFYLAVHSSSVASWCFYSSCARAYRKIKQKAV